MPHRILIVAALAVGCQSATHTKRVPPPTPPPLLDAGPAADPPPLLDAGPAADAPVGTAKVASDEGSAAGVPANLTDFRELVLPRPRTLKPASPASTRCLNSDREGAVRQHELARHAAALDRVIRKRGLTPLPEAQLLTYSNSLKLGDIVRGPKGERLMFIAKGSGCASIAPTVAMNAAREVIAVWPNFVARSSRTIKLCKNSCYGMCGAASQRYFGVEVPADSKLGAPIELDVPLDVQVTLEVPPDSNCFLP